MNDTHCFSAVSVGHRARTSYLTPIDANRRVCASSILHPSILRRFSAWCSLFSRQSSGREDLRHPIRLSDIVTILQAE